MLETRIIPSGVTAIGERAFAHYDELTSIIIPDSVTTIGDYAFCGCSKLTSMIIPAGVKEIPDTVFKGCRSLEWIVSPIMLPLNMTCSFLTVWDCEKHHIEVSKLFRDALHFITCSKLPKELVCIIITYLVDKTRYMYKTRYV